MSEKSEALFTLKVPYLVCEQQITDLTHGSLTLAVPEDCIGHYILAQGVYQVRCENFQLRLATQTYTLEELTAFAAKLPASMIEQQLTLTYKETEWSMMKMKSQRSPCPASLNRFSFATGTLSQQPFTAQLCTANPIATAGDLDRIFGAMEPMKPWTKACENGDVRACFNLGVVYFNGEGVPKDHPRALELWTKSCALDDFESCYALGAVYEAGEGVPKDAARAVDFLKKACDGGFKQACERLP